MTGRILLIASAAIILALGLVHLVFTFRGTRLHPRDAALLARMQEVSPIISRETTMWKASIGFHASHSLGAILFGLVYGYLALVHPALLFGSTFLLALGAATLLGYTWLAKVYWFRIPLTGIALALVCYLAGLMALI